MRIPGKHIKCEGLMVSLLICVWLLVVPVTQAHAYLGPGVGVGIIGTVLGIIGSIILGIFSIIYYPIKRALKKLRKKTAKSPQSAVDGKER